MTTAEFAALERRLADGVASGSATWSYARDVQALLAECRALRVEVGGLRRPPDLAGLMPAAELARVRAALEEDALRRPAEAALPGWLSTLRALAAHADALDALVRELYGVVADLHADDPGRQALLERGRAEGREMVLGILWKFFGTPDPAEYPALAEAFEVAHALGPVRPPLPPHAAEAEAGRLRDALRAVVTAGDIDAPYGALARALAAARKALAGDTAQ